MRTIQYGLDTNSGLVVSRVGGEVAVPILDWDAMTPSNGFAMTYYLERCPVFSLAGRAWDAIKWTRKLPAEVKNLHRAFWGFKSLD